MAATAASPSVERSMCPAAGLPGGAAGAGGRAGWGAPRGSPPPPTTRDRAAGRARHGEGAKRHGAEGADRTIRVPVGTVVVDEESGETLFDFTEPGQQLTVARGGRGGRGNARFATSTNRPPRRGDPREGGEEGHLRGGGARCAG